MHLVDQTVQQISDGPIVGGVPNLLAPENFTTTSHNLTNMNDVSNHEIEENVRKSAVTAMIPGRREETSAGQANGARKMDLTPGSPL